MPQEKAVEKLGAIAPGTRLIVPPGGSKVFEELKTPQTPGLKNSPKQNTPAPQTFASPTGTAEITLPGWMPNDASEIINGAFGRSGTPEGPGFVFVKIYAPFGSRGNLKVDWRVASRSWVCPSRGVERFPEAQNPCTENGPELPEALPVLARRA